MSKKLDHGGGLDAAVARHGGSRSGWIDLSTGINPVPYPVPSLSHDAWTALPDRNMQDRLTRAARRFWNVPDDAAVLAAPGASALIAQIPRLEPPDTVTVPAPTYNEHAAGFAAAGWRVQTKGSARAQVLVHPNNPDGTLWAVDDVTAPFAVIDESFCDITPVNSLMDLSTRPGTLVLKSFGKFWGLAGLRLGFLIGDPALVNRVQDMLGPWPVSGIALQVGATALEDTAWADATRARLAADATRLDTLMNRAGADLVGGTDLFRLYRVDDAETWQTRLAKQHIWTRVFPYAPDWIRVGLPAPDHWDRLGAAL